MARAPATSTPKRKHFLIAGDIWLLSFLFLVVPSFVFVAVVNLDSGWRVPLLPYLSSLIHAEAHGDKSRPVPKNQSFTLRHIYHRGATLFPDLHRRFDLSPAIVKNANLQGIDLRDEGIGLYMTSSSPSKIWRLRDRRVEDVEALLNSAQSRGVAAQLPDSAWNFSDVSSPDITDKETVVNLALMAANAYNFDSTSPDWEDVTKPFNLSSDVGWENDGLRGHVFADETNSTIVISIKGTSAAVFDGAETTTNDKINDNLFAGCCCGQGTVMAKKACNCMTSTYTCNENCICEEMHKRSRYYQASIDLYGNITEKYPKANVWLTGHSLGGLVTSLLGLTFGVPVVTFESIPHALAASRLGIPSPPGYDSVVEARQNGGLWNFGHTADPVYMGTCNGASSLCTMAGYALQSQCHTGLRCVYDCERDGECVDCFEWKKDYSNITKTSTISSTTSSQSSSSKTHTRRETCKTPGWWGCLDETTTPASTRTSTTTLTITTCKSYGWFGGCLESTTTTTTSTTTIAAATATGNSIPFHLAHTTSTSTRDPVYGY
jgi:lipase ATG15